MLVDLAPVWTSAVWGGRREAIRLKRTTAARVLDAVEHHRGRPGTSRLASGRNIPYQRTRSDAEARALEVLHDAAIAAPRVNVKVAGEEADLVWPERRLIVEVDGPAVQQFPDEMPEATRLARCRLRRPQGRQQRGRRRAGRAGGRGRARRARLSSAAFPRSEVRLHVQVRLGSGLATAAGTSRLRVQLPPAATVETLLDRLGELEPAIAEGLGSALAVVQGTHANDEQPLADGDEVAVLIPVAGGTGPFPTERSQAWQ